jgi:hypothetical protein
MLRVVAMLALAASLLAVGPADAHVGGGDLAKLEALRLPPQPEHPSLSDSTGSPATLAPDRVDAPWPIALAALLAAASLSRRRSRRLVVVALAALVAISGVEAAVHSVHHALGDDPVACPTASFAAHVDGTTVAALALDGPIHRIGTVPAPSDPLLAAPRSLDPSQPRAPPTPLV